MSEQTEIEEFADELVDAILSTVQLGDPKEFGECHSDLSDIFQRLSTKDWGVQALRFREHVTDIAKQTSLDARREERLSYPPSDYSPTEDPISLTLEGCYQVTGHYTTYIYAMPELKEALIDSMKKRGIEEDNVGLLLTREWKILANMMNLPEIAELTRTMPAYEDFNQSKQRNRSLANARRKIEHTVNGKIVEKVSLETGGMDENGNTGDPLEIPDTADMVSEVTDKVFAEQCMAVLTDEDREIMMRYAEGETLESLAGDFGYKTPGGMLKRIDRIRTQIKGKIKDKP
ncbi:MAG: hypothetical protein II710_00515 [Clostridia bacterium]|nr:hypothetical protein [Clostridia bacterium]